MPRQHDKARRCKAIVGLQVLCGLLLACVVPAAAQPSPRPPLALSHRWQGGTLEPVLRAWRLRDGAALRQAAENGRALVEGGLQDGLWRLQLHVAGDPALAVDETQLAAHGGRVAAHGLDLVDIWLPLAALEPFLAAHPRVTFVQLPWRMVATVGPKTSEGAPLLRTPEMACLAADGTGTVVAVLDEGFEHLGEAAAAGEVPNLIGSLPGGSGDHGTMCCEVVADVAPGTAIYPTRTGTFAELQAFAKQLRAGSNPKGVSLVSHSAIWFGMSFGRHSGKACEVTDLVREGGVAWVNAAGNSSGGSFYRAAFSDSDGDGLHEFLPGVERLFFQQGGGRIQINLDWDDYDKRTVNLDLELWRQTGADKWELVDQSNLKANKYVPPMEQVAVDDAKAGNYALQVRAGGKVPQGMRLRIVSVGYGTAPFSVWHNNGNVYDPASCEGVLAVGAIQAGQYTTGPLEGYSSYGPTADGRLKPEVMAPTGVSTSRGAFYGTSAACPHAAGALAIWTAQTGQTAESLVPAMQDQAIPMGVAFPDESYGFGRVTLPPQSLGWDCSPTALPAPATCATACGSTGSRSCTQGCTWSPCEAPAEVCNGNDDDCDGSTDEGLSACTGGADASSGDSGPTDGEDGGTVDGVAAAADATAAAGGVAAPPTHDDGGCRSTPVRHGRSGWVLVAAVAFAVLRLQRARRAG